MSDSSLKQKENDEQKRRWDEIDLKMKFKTCEEAEIYWESDWTSCPVCGHFIELVNPLESDDVFVPIHKSPELIRN